MATVVLVLGAAVFANLIATRIAWRFDLTEDRVYTLSPASRALVSSLPDELTVKAYFSRDLPPALASVARYARELLEEYRRSSQGKLRFEVLDPGADTKLDEQAGRCRIGKMAVEVRNAAKREVGQYMLGLCLWYDGKSRALAPIDGTAGLEYQISALIKLMTQKRRKVAFTAGHGERDLGQDYSFVKHALDQELDVVTLDPSTSALSDDVDLVAVAGPRRPFDERARRELDAFLMKGRPALFLIDGMELADAAGTDSDQPRRGLPIDSGLEPLLAAYGFRVGRDFAFDRLTVPGPVDLAATAAPRGPLFVNLPAFVVARPDPALAKELSVTAGIDALVFPFASSLELVGPLAQGAAASPDRVWTLARTSTGAWRQTEPFPMSAAAPAETAPGHSSTPGEPLALAYAYRGPLASAYPAIDPSDHRGGATGTTGRTSPRPVRLVVVGDSDFVSDRYMQLMRSFPIYAGGAQLLLNAVSWALEDDALTALRANVLKARSLRLDAGGDGQDQDRRADERATLLKWGNVAGVPLAVCAAGLLRWRRRSAARRHQTLDGGRAPRS